MKVLVIPDCHLKPNMFKRAAELLEKRMADRAVYLGDTPDDYNCQNNIPLYEETFDALISFVKKYPDTLVCYGNHDLSYLWRKLETGYSYMAEATVVRKIAELDRALPKDNPMKYVQRIDNVLFCHGGVCEYFVDDCVKKADYDDVDAVLDEINRMHVAEMWQDSSPIWLRPQNGLINMYKQDELLQVVGHTPIAAINRRENFISCDVFSTYSDGTPIGTCEYIILDTETWEYVTVK